MGAVENLLLRSAFNLTGFQWVITYTSRLFIFLIHSEITSCNGLPICLIHFSVICRAQKAWLRSKKMEKKKEKNEKFHTSCSCRFFSCAKNGILVRQWTAIWNVKNVTEKPFKTDFFLQYVFHMCWLYLIIGVTTRKNFHKWCHMTHINHLQ